MTVIRRLDACLESTRQDVLKMSEQLGKAEEEIKADLRKLQGKGEGLLEEIVGGPDV